MNHESWIKTVFHFAAPCKGKMTLAVLLELLSVGSGLIPYIGVYQILMLFFKEAAAMHPIIPLALLCLAGYAGKILLHAIATTLSHISAYSILEQIRLAMTRKLMHAPLGTVLAYTGGELKSVIIDRVETIELPLAHVIPEGISNLFIPISVFLYMLYIDWRMALASLICVPLAALIYAFVLKSFNQKYADYMTANNHVNSVIVEYMEGIEVIKAFGRSGSSYERYQNAVSVFKEYTLDWFRTTWKHMTLGGAVLPSTLLGALPAGMALYLTGTIAPASIVMCMILSMGIVAPLTSFTVFVNDLKTIQYAVRDAKEILDLSELPDPSAPAVLTDHSIRLDSVTFRYETASKENPSDALKQVSLSIPSGSYTALVGPSGSGKSTIARLIARYWDVTEGRILIGGADIRSIPLSQLSKTISFVTQDNFLFNCSLKENIRMGNPSAGDDEVYAAAKAALCDEFISRLPDGYDTDAGVAGARLSGGERQRIAIARAILKDAPIIILDEATAFTDPENEEKLQQSILALTRPADKTERKTLLVIAHRLSTVKDADTIAVLQNGTVSDIGAHDHLMEHSPLYHSLWLSHVGAKNWSAGRKQPHGHHGSTSAGWEASRYV